MLTHRSSVRLRCRAHRPRHRARRAALAVAVAVALGPVLLAAPLAQASTCDLVGAVGSGTLGTSANPYAVADADDLKEVGVDCPLNGHYRQTADIELPAPAPGSSNHVPIGTSLDRFRGTFDGAGHVISGLVIDSPSSADPVGLFGSVAGATISAVRLSGIAVEGDVDVGALIGYAAGATISDIVVSGSVTGRYKVGGLVGRALEVSSVRVDISDVATDVDVTARSHPDPSGSDHVQQIGGLVGEANGVDIVRSAASGPVVAAADGLITRVGGLVGDLEEGSIVRSSASGDVTATAVSNATRVGGLVGSLVDGSVSASFATGDVTGRSTGVGSAQSVGGLVGYGESELSDFELDDVFAGGDVAGEEYIGGLVGELRSSGGRIDVSAAIAIGSVVATVATPFVGGLFGDHDNDPVSDVLTAVFWDETTTGQSSSGTFNPGSVEGRPTADLQRFATFPSGWQIVDGWVAYDPLANPVWGICDGAGYPFLLWTVTSDPCVSGGAAPPGNPSAVTVGVASAQAAAAGVAGSVSGVRVRGAEVLPVTVGLSGSVGPRGGVVLTSDGMQVRVASELGARAGAGVVVPSGGVFEASVSAPLVPGSVVEAWVNSTPRLVAAAEVPADGGPVTVAIPTGAPLDGGGPVVDGAHTLELRMFTTDGFEVVAMGITVGQVMPTGVPAGEGRVPSPSGAGLLVMLALLGVVAAAVRGLRGSAVSR